MTSGTSRTGLRINLTWDSSVASAPTGFTAGIQAAVLYLESQFSDSVTVNINVGYGEVSGKALTGNALGESASNLKSLAYSTLIGALASDSKTATDASVVASLPAVNPSGGTYWVTTAQAKALGLASANGTSSDGSIGFSGTAGIFSYSDATGVAAGTYDFYAVALHEITEVMGRMVLAGETIGSTANSYGALDLLHYQAPGQLDFSATTPGYMSLNGGTTNAGSFNTAAGGDAGDWASSMGNDAFDAFASPGVVNAVSASDLATLDAIGWDSAAGIVAQTSGASLAVTLTGIGSAYLTTAGQYVAGTGAVTVRGTGEADSVVTLFDGAVAIGTAIANAQGAWSITPAALSGGVHSLTEAAKDAKGNVSAPSTALSLNVWTSSDPLFDPVYYLAANPAVAASGVDPYQQFMATGWKQGSSPSAWFDTSYYLAHNPDVAATGVNPLTHFETRGFLEGRNPSAAFDTSDYLAANPDVKASGADPLVAYLTQGQYQGRAAFAVPAGMQPPGVDAAYYYATYADVKNAGTDAAWHYFNQGFTEGRNPDAFFDTNYYLTQNPDVKAAGDNPLRHYIDQGFLEGRDISLVFSAAKYDAAHPGFTGDALLAWLATSPASTDLTYISGGAEPANAIIDTAYYDRQLGATLIPGGTPGAQQAMWSYDTSGWQRGLDPSATFSTSKYLAAYADARASGLNPVSFYLQTGQYEGEVPIHT